MERRRTGENAKLWEEMQSANDAMEELSRNDISCVTQCVCTAFLYDGGPSDLHREDTKNSWEPSVSRSTTDCVPMLILLSRKGTTQLISIGLCLFTGDEISKLLQPPVDVIDSFFHNLFTEWRYTIVAREDHSNPTTREEWTTDGDEMGP